MTRKHLHESLYRGDEVLSRLGDINITLCGAGAVGSLLADNLVRQGFAKLKVIDADRVEEHNVGSQLYGVCDVGAQKVDALQSRLFRNVEVEIEPVARRLDERNAARLLKGADLVIDAFDNAASRDAVQRAVRELGAACLHVGLFEDYCEVVWDESYRVPQDSDEDVCDYPLARSLVLLAAALASETVMSWAIDQARISRTATLRDFAVREFGGAASEQ